MPAEKKWFQVLCVSGLMLLHLVLCNTSLSKKSLTVDEHLHFGYGLMYLLSNPDRIDDSKMPVTGLNALAVLSDVDLAKSFGGISFEEIQKARRVTTLFSACIVGVAFLWAKYLYGVVPAMLAAFLCALSPNMIAHGRLITTDNYAGLSAIASLFTFWLYMQKGGWKYGVLSACVIGISQATKFTCIFLYPIILIIATCRCFTELSSTWKAKDSEAIKQIAKRLLLNLVIYIGVGLLMINIAYYFHRSFTPLSAYEFKSAFFKGVQATLSPLGGLPIPLPAAYVEGIDWVRYMDSEAGVIGSIYMLGENRFGGRFITFYLVCLLFKLPLPTLCLCAAVIFRRFKERWDKFLEKEIFLLIPFLAYFILLSLFYRTQVGIRHLLIVLPFLFVLCGRAVIEWEGFSTRMKACLGLLLVWLSLSVLSYHPHYIPYFNELILDRKMSYKVLADSNLDWGQDKIYMKEFLEKNPDVVSEPKSPMAGRMIVSANLLTGVFDEGRYEWLRDNMKPVGHLCYSYLIFELSDEEAARWRAHENSKVGNPGNP